MPGSANDFIQVSGDCCRIGEYQITINQDEHGPAAATLVNQLFRFHFSPSSAKKPRSCFNLIQVFT